MDGATVCHARRSSDEGPGRHARGGGGCMFPLLGNRSAHGRGRTATLLQILVIVQAKIGGAHLGEIPRGAPPWAPATRATVQLVSLLLEVMRPHTAPGLVRSGAGQHAAAGQKWRVSPDARLRCRSAGGPMADYCPAAIRALMITTIGLKSASTVAWSRSALGFRGRRREEAAGSSLAGTAARAGRPALPLLDVRVEWVGARDTPALDRVHCEAEPPCMTVGRAAARVAAARRLHSE
jgi:hypothetical protein